MARKMIDQIAAPISGPARSQCQLTFLLRALRHRCLPDRRRYESTGTLARLLSAPGDPVPVNRLGREGQGCQRPIGTRP